MALIGDRGDILDDGGHIADAYGLRADEWVLIRPDGYLAGVFGGHERQNGLERYLDGVLPAKLR